MSDSFATPWTVSPPRSSVHEISQARILERVAVPFSRGLPNPRIESRSPALQVDSLPAEPQGKFDIENELVELEDIRLQLGT